MPRITISGSFRRHYAEIKSAIQNFESLGFVVLSPRSSDILNPDADIIVLATDSTTEPTSLEAKHLQAIKNSDALYICNPGGYVGASTTLELGYALALDKPIFSREVPTDAMIKHFTGTVATPQRIKEILVDRTPLGMISNQSSLEHIQLYIQSMVIRRGFGDETSKDVLLLLMEEVGELTKALRKSHGLKTDQSKPQNANIKHELADIFIYLLQLSNLLNVSLFNAFVEKEKINETRSWK